MLTAAKTVLFGAVFLVLMAAIFGLALWPGNRAQALHCADSWLQWNFEASAGRHVTGIPICVTPNGLESVPPTDPYRGYYRPHYQYAYYSQPYYNNNAGWGRSYYFCMPVGLYAGKYYSGWCGQYYR